MSVYMRAVLTAWPDPPFESLSTFLAEQSPFSTRSSDGRGWHDFEVVNEKGTTVLAADLSRGPSVREEAAELEELLEDLDGPDSSRETVRAYLARASAVVGMQILMSVYDESVASANAVIDFLEQFGGMLTQVDTVGWYDGPRLLLAEPD